MKSKLTIAATFGCHKLVKPRKTMGFLMLADWIRLSNCRHITSTPTQVLFCCLLNMVPLVLQCWIKETHTVLRKMDKLTWFLRQKTSLWFCIIGLMSGFSWCVGTDWLFAATLWQPQLSAEVKQAFSQTWKPCFIVAIDLFFLFDLCRFSDEIWIINSVVFTLYAIFLTTKSPNKHPVLRKDE